MESASLLHALLLPLRTAPLLLVAIFSALLVVGVVAGLPGLPILLIVGSWFFKYGFIMLDHAAEGRPGAPVLAAEDINPLGEFRPLAYGLAIVAFYGLTRLLEGWAGPEFAIALRLLGLLVLPIVLATHTITGSLAQALHPAVVAETARGLGPGYLVVLLAMLGCGLLGEAVVLDGGHLSLWLRIALLMLLWLAMFSALGGVIHSRRLDLGFEPEHSPERTRARLARDVGRERDRFADELFAEFRSGSPRNALETIRRRVAASPDPLAEYAWIHERVAGWPDARLADRVAQDWLPRLLAARRNGEALRVVKARLAANPDFRPATAGEVLQLARLARDGGDRALARTLLAGFDSRFEDTQDRDAARRIAAQLDDPRLR